MKNLYYGYRTDFGVLSLKRFSPLGVALLMEISLKARDGKSPEESVVVHFEGLRKMCGYKARDSVFRKDLDNALGDLLHVEYEREFEWPYQPDYTRLFRAPVDLDFQKAKVTFLTEEKGRFVVTSIAENFTPSELNEFAGLDSAYAKRLFMILKPCRQLGHFVVSIVELRKFLVIPESCRDESIINEILKPALAELQSIFENLTVTPFIPEGNTITAFTFEFDV